MAHRLAVGASLALAAQSVLAQKPGNVPENHPALTTYKCTTAGGCVSQKTSLVIDWNAHRLETPSGTSCTTSSGNTDPTLCGTSASCNQNCVIQGYDYANGGVRTSGNSLTLNQYVPNGNGGYRAASPRVYLLDESGKSYESVKLTNQELTFDVDMSATPCGMNGALYLSEMDMSGGRSSTNPGAEYGGGYCDAQCPKITWLNGTVNNGVQGSCCNEMDIWEANGRATGYTAHPCSVESIGGCTGDECGFNGVCDQWGCGFNPYEKGKPQYYGAGSNFVIDTRKPFTVTTQFITDDGSESGELIDIRRTYIQEGRKISNAISTEGLQSITSDYCDAATVEGKRLGGLETQGRALERGSVLIFSIWNSDGDFMNWLDSGNSGPCSATEGDPALILKNQPDTHVTWSNIRWGDIGSTTPKSGSGSSTTMSTSTTKKPSPTSTSKAPTPTSGATVAHYGQCGGQGYTGPTKCASPYTCKKANDYYSQCL